MSAYRKSLFVVIPVSFAIGLWWGLKTFRRDPAPAGGTVRVLAYDGILSEALLARFRSATHIHAIVDKAATPEEALTKLEANPKAYDVVSLFSYQVPQATATRRLAPLNQKLLRNMFSVPADFQDVPGDLNHEHLAPVLWGLTGFAYDAKRLASEPQSWQQVFATGALKKKVTLLNSPVDLFYLISLRSDGPEEWAGLENAAQIKKPVGELAAFADFSRRALWADLKESSTMTDHLVLQMNHGQAADLPADSGWKFVLPQEKALFWVLSFGVVSDAAGAENAHRFLNFLLEKESALELASFTRQASTSRHLEEADVPPARKPSYLRSVPLTQIHLVPEFNGGLVVSAALNQTLNR